jgi:FG-GAP repeat/Tetratricopeptide repeat
MIRNIATIAALLLGLSVLVVDRQASAQFAPQGPKLVGNDPSFYNQGASVALSFDGNTALIGAPWGAQFGQGGAAWLFERKNGTWAQQQPALIGAGVGNMAEFGSAVAMSRDANTLIVGGPGDNALTGGVWVFTRSNGVLKQQGPKLFGTGADAESGMGVSQGRAVALSADGHTAAIGAQPDNQYMGAVWVFTQINGVWSQQGPKLVGFDRAPHATDQGYSVALSGDGNTLIVGGVGDDGAAADGGSIGATWVFVRAGNVWSQQGPKLVASEYDLSSNQGWSVALSDDGNTAIVGGHDHATGHGAAWVWTRQNGIWSQQGPKLIGTGAIGGWQPSVALAADGNTAIVGDPGDNNSIGAAWAYIRNNGVWTQLGSKILGTGTVANDRFGTSVALSADGRTALIGGECCDDPNSPNKGGAWVFELINRPAVPPSNAISVPGQRCYLDLTGGYPAAAIDACTNAIALNSNDETALVNRCAAYDEQHNYSAAVSDCTKAAALNPNQEYAYQERGLAYQALGDKADAIADFRMVLRLNPANQLARTQLTQLGDSTAMGAPLGQAPALVPMIPAASGGAPVPIRPAAPRGHGAPVPIRRSNP